MTSFYVTYLARASLKMSDEIVAEQRTIIKFDVKLGKTVSEIKDDLNKVYDGDSSLLNTA